MVKPLPGLNESRNILSKVVIPKLLASTIGKTLGRQRGMMGGCGTSLRSPSHGKPAARTGRDHGGAQQGSPQLVRGAGEKGHECHPGQSGLYTKAR